MGVFEGRRAMLIDGVILEQGPMSPPHAITLGLVEEAVRTAFGAGWWLRQQLPLVLGQDTDPQPDLAVVPGRPRDYAGHPTTADLVVEVADSSLSFDTNDKRLLYARAGIRDYWVVDVNGRRLLVYRDPPGRRLRRPTGTRPGRRRLAVGRAGVNGAGSGPARVTPPNPLLLQSGHAMGGFARFAVGAARAGCRAWNSAAGACS
jgi:hypothetical protein